MKVGDLVRYTSVDPEPSDAGLVIDICRDVEVPPLIEILWNNGYISKIYQDDLEVFSETN